MQLKGSQTEKNLEAALAGESIARNKYTFYSDKAKADGYEQIAELFEETAKNEKAHAQIWYNLLKGKTSTTEETDTSGGTRKVEQTDSDKEIVYQEENGKKTPIVQKTLQPKIEGAIITAKGASTIDAQDKIAWPVPHGFVRPSGTENPFGKSSIF